MIKSSDDGIGVGSVRSLWLFFLPFIYTPNPGIEVATAAGTFEISDFLSPVLIFFILITDKAQHRIYVNKMMTPFVAFILTVLLSILVIPFIYPEYPDPFKPVKLSILKLAKFLMYAYVGIAIARCISDEKNYVGYHYSLLFCGVMTAIGLIVAGVLAAFYPFIKTVDFYEAANQISVVIAMIILYLGVLYLEGYGSVRWRKIAMFSLITMMVGLFMTEGRGGWLALMAAYVVYNIYRPLRGRNLMVVSIGVIAVVSMYFMFPPFTKQVNNTFFRSEEYMKRYKVGVGGFDDGARLSSAINELKKFPNRPILGTGFYHRGRYTGLWPNGSHNFFLQMLLETGFLGMGCLVYILVAMFRQGAKVFAVNEPVSLAYRVTFVGFVIGAMSGEYFYGGLGLLTFFLVYAPVGCIKLNNKENSIELQRD